MPIWPAPEKLQHSRVFRRKRGQYPFAGTARRVLHKRGLSPFPSVCYCNRVAVFLERGICGGAARLNRVGSRRPRSEQSLDQIFPQRGSAASGTVVEMNPTEVKLDVRGEPRTFAVNDIRRMIFAEDPPELRRARDDIATGQLEQALEALKRVDAGRITRDFVRNDLRYYLAYCEGRLALTGGGDKTAAAAAMLEFVKQNSNSYHFYEAAGLLGDLAMATENPENALKYYAAIGRAPWPEYQLRTALLEAAALTALSRYAEALTRYESVLASTLDTPESLRQKLIAQSGKAVCLAENGRADEGIALLEEMIAKNDPGDADLFGRIYNALGRCQMKAERPQESLMAFLHTDLLFNGNPEIHAEALYYLSKLWTTVNKPDRATTARNLLVERYAGSVWAKRS